MENYNRVIPRDFFNEAKLLKCMGMLALKVLDNMTPQGVKISIDETGESFDIALSDDGYLFLANYTTTVNSHMVIFKTRYNDKGATPFYCEHAYNEVEVFDDKGEFSEEFIAYFSNLPF